MREVIFYIPSLGAGGAERQCAYLATALQRDHGCKCTIIVTRLNRASKANLDLVKKVGVRMLEYKWFNPIDLLRMLCFFFKHRHAVLFCYQTFPDFFGCLIARCAGLKDCYGGVRVQYLPPRFMAMEYIVHFLFSKKTIFNSYKGRDDFLERHFNSKNCLVISNAIESPRICKDYDKPNVSTIRLITVGRFKPSKDYRTLIRVIKSVVDKGVQVECVFVGYGQLEGEIRRWLNEEGVEKHVTLLPGMSVDVQSELAKSDIYISTSIFEGTSNSIMEALNAGLPVVATDVGDNAYLIQNGESGYICPVRDADSLASAVLELASDAEKRKAFGLRGMQRMKSNHSVKAIVQQFVKLL